MGSFQSRRVRVVLLGLVGFLVLWVDPAGAKKKHLPYTIVPAVGSRTEMGAGVEIVRVHRGDLTGEVSYVSGIARRRMMQATLNIDFDPFATPPGQAPRFHTFLVYLQNNSAHDLFFNPTLSRVVTDRDDHEYAREYSYLYETLGRATGLEMDQIQKVVYDRPMTLRPGGKAKKLLVFREIPGKKWKEFRLMLTMERDGRATVNMTVPFRRVYLDRKP